MKNINHYSEINNLKLYWAILVPVLMSHDQNNIVVTSIYYAGKKYKRMSNLDEISDI